MQATVFMTRTVGLSPLPHIRALELHAAAVLLITSFAKPEIAYAPIRRPNSDRTSAYEVEPCTQVAPP
jgi:hypothetical protein